MSEESPFGAVENEVRSAYDRLPEIAGKRKKLRILRIAIPLIILIVVVGGMLMLGKKAVDNVVDRKDELIHHFQQRSTSMLHKLETQAVVSANKVLPRLQEEMVAAQKKAAANLEDVMHTQTEGMGQRLNKKMNDKLEAALGVVHETQKQKLQSTFPEKLKCAKTDDAATCKKKEEALERIMDEIQRSYRDWAIQEMRTTFDGHLKAMDDIRKTMSSFGATRTCKADADCGDAGKCDAGTCMGDKLVKADAPGDMLMMWLELVAETMGGDSGLFDEPAKAEEVKKGE